MTHTILVNMLSAGAPAMPDGVAAVATLRPVGPFGLAARALLRRVSPRFITLFEDYTALDDALPGARNVILFDYKGLDALCRRVEEHAPQARKIVMYWNTVGPAAPKRRPGWEIWTFDPGDARRHGMRFVDQFFFGLPTDVTIPAECDRDISFVGRNKGRFGLLKKFERMWGDDLRLDFRRVSHTAPVGGTVRAVSYADYLRAGASARAMLEITARGQEGITLRTLEALAMGRKLLTTNAAIARHPLYDPRMVRIVTPATTAAEIRDFLDAPAQAAPSLKPYLFPSWLARSLADTTCR